MPVEDYLQSDGQEDDKPSSHCAGCGLLVDEWPMHSHQWIEGTDTVYCREVGGQFEVKRLTEEHIDES